MRCRRARAVLGVGLAIASSLIASSAGASTRHPRVRETSTTLPTPVYALSVGETLRLQHLAHHLMSPLASSSANTLVAQGGPGGNEVETLIGSPKVYLVFWGSQWGTETTSGGYDSFSGDPQGMAPVLEQMYAGLGTAGEQWSTTTTQYCSGVSAGATSCPTGSTFVSYPSSNVLAGVWYDNSQPAPSSATQSQIAAEADAAATYFGNTTPSSNAAAQYVVVLPTKTTPWGSSGFISTTGNFCAWHSYDYHDGGVAYTNLPYIPDAGGSCGANFVNSGSAGLLDGVTIVAGHEYAETLTDPSANYGWLTSSTMGQEIGDLCAWITPGSPGGSGNVALATGSFPMQSLWSNTSSSCTLGATSGVVPNLFSLSTSSSATLVTGSSTSLTLTTAVTSGVSQPVALTVSGLPSGVSAAFQSSSLNAGGTTQLTLTSSSLTAPGTYPLVITGTGNSDSSSVDVSLVVSVPNLFSLSTSSSATLVTGSSTSLTLTTAVTSGVGQSVALTVSGLPSGVSAAFQSSSLNAGGTTQLTLTSSSLTAPGTYPLVITGTGNSDSATSDVSLVVSAPNLFSLSTPSFMTIVTGSSTVLTLGSTVTSGGSQTITFAVSGLPRGVSGSFSSPDVTAGQTTSLTLVATSHAVGGDYLMTVTGTGSGGAMTSTTTSVRVRVAPSRFGIRWSGTRVVGSVGTAHELRLMTRVTSGLSQALSLRVRHIPPHVTIIVTPARRLSGQSFTVRVRVLAGARPGVDRLSVAVRGTTESLGSSFTLVIPTH